MLCMIARNPSMAEWHVSDLKFVSETVGIQLPEISIVFVSVELLLEVLNLTLHFAPEFSLHLLQDLTTREKYDNYITISLHTFSKHIGYKGVSFLHIQCNILHRSNNIRISCISVEFPLVSSRNSNVYIKV